MNYETLNEQMQGRCYESRKVGNNTYLKRRGENIAVRLHNTDVVTFSPNGDIVLDSGGWKTVTTKERMNRFLPKPFTLWQEKGEWFVGKGYWSDPNRQEFPYKDGITINAQSETVDNIGIHDPKATKKVKNRVKKYAQFCANSIPLPRPSGADCWHCYFMGEDGRTWGDVTGDVTHLDSHIKEKYAVPSLVYHALKDAGNSDVVIWAAFKDPENTDVVSDFFKGIAHERVTRHVYKYIMRRKGYAV